MGRNSELVLHRPSTTLSGVFLEYAAEFQTQENVPFWHPNPNEDFVSYVERLPRVADGAEPGFVRMSTFWFMQSSRMVGESRIRHEMPPELADEGQIGFAVRPSARGGGIGTRLLALTLEQARSLGRDAVTITCDTDNMGSARVIVKNGGTLVSRAVSETTKKELDHYIIRLPSAG